MDSRRLAEELPGAGGFMQSENAYQFVETAGRMIASTRSGGEGREEAFTGQGLITVRPISCS